MYDTVLWKEWALRSALSRLLRSFCRANRKGAGGTAQAVEALVKPVVEAMGLRLWDVRFEKEGPDWFLRIYLDGNGRPLDMELCEAATRAINPVLDEADPISQSYYLEVGSPGLGRRLTRDEHFAAKRGEKVRAHLIRADEAGRREVAGVLLGKEGTAVRLALEDGTEAVLDTKLVSAFRLCDDEDLF